MFLLWIVMIVVIINILCIVVWISIIDCKKLWKEIMLCLCIRFIRYRLLYLYIRLVNLYFVVGKFEIYGEYFW